MCGWEKDEPTPEKSGCLKPSRLEQNGFAKCSVDDTVHYAFFSLQMGQQGAYNQGMGYMQHQDCVCLSANVDGNSCTISAGALNGLLNSI
ncbi:uncharacterized protein [Miscanthus floridulus]|uniref:uncharacterized protein isoform X2 n=1 Tax=Miscanthus floridulus TaxID=154761 RepID=UPI0034585E28